MTTLPLRRLLDALFQVELTDEQYKEELRKILENPDFKRSCDPIVLKSKAGLAHVSEGNYRNREVKA